MAACRWTEQPSPLTEDLDVAPSDLHLVRLLAACDAGLFTPHAGLPGVPDVETLTALAAVAAPLAAAALAHPRGRVVLCGCGTSGRLAHLEARALNAIAAARGLRNDCFTYLLAGGDAALVLSQEAAEDRPDAGRDALAALLAESAASDAAAASGDAAPFLVVGISCGLSAAFVGSLLEFALTQPPHVGCVAVGFNPVEAVRGLRVEGWASSFYDVLVDITTNPALARRAALLNPCLGPEAVAGSSRMKGGSATKMLVETLGLLAMAMAGGTLSVPASVSSPSTVGAVSAARDILAEFELAVRSVYFEAPDVAALVHCAAAALTSRANIAGSAAASGAGEGGFLSSTGRGRVFYLGVGSAGLLGLIDASECPPTYGSYFNDVRGFLGGGWAELANKEGRRMALRVPPHLRADMGAPTAAIAEPIELGLREGFLARGCTATLGPSDLVILLAIHGDRTGYGSNEGGVEDGPSDGLRLVLEGAAVAARAGCTVRHVIVGGRAEGSASSSGPFLRLEAAVSAVAPEGVRVLLRESSGLDSALGLAPGSTQRCACELALKLVLNAVTTGAFVATGALIGNRMVNVRVSNKKLFLRAIGIVAKVGGVSPAAARRAILRATYALDDAADLDQLDADERDNLRAVEVHVARASVAEKVTPVALLLVLAPPALKLTVEGARQLLACQPAVRKAAAELKAESPC